MPSRLTSSMLLLAVLTAGCRSKKADNSLAGQLNSMAPANGPARADPCSLVDPADVAAAIGPLAGAPYRGQWDPDPRSNTCRYDTKDHRRLFLSVDWSGGPTAMKVIRFGRGLTDQVSKQGERRGDRP